MEGRGSERRNGELWSRRGWIRWSVGRAEILEHTTFPPSPCTLVDHCYRSHLARSLDRTEPLQTTQSTIKPCYTVAPLTPTRSLQQLSIPRSVDHDWPPASGIANSSLPRILNPHSRPPPHPTPHPSESATHIFTPHFTATPASSSLSLLQPHPCPRSAMCYLETEGTKHGCGHYVISKKLMKHDCGNRYCRNSAAHPPNCPDCQCDLYYGPDRKETITRTVTDYCAHCAYWFKGGAQAARRAQQ